ncbi:MAG TPA: VOC family protein [Acidimicrobiia bacterium]|jgi:lactoylglutathione lyase
MVSRAFAVFYSSDVERAGQFWEKLGFERHYQLPAEGEPGYIGLRSGAAEMAVTSADWAVERYGISVGTGPRVEMYVYVPDLDLLFDELQSSGVQVLREPEDMPWGERIAAVADTDGNPVALCQEK